MRNGNVLNVLVISILLGLVYLGSIVAQDALKPSSGSNTANAVVGGLTCGVVCPTVESRIKALEQKVTTLQAKLDAAESALALADDLTECMSVDTNTINGLVGPHVIFEGCNVHVQDGSDHTFGPTNGLGNLIVGYNEQELGGTYDRTGSHNLVVGSEHSYSGLGGFVAGFFNTISGDSASVSGGFVNIASGNNSSVSGGNNNEAKGGASSVSGGFNNHAEGGTSSISGGVSNIAEGESSSISGGARGFVGGPDDWLAGDLFQDE